MKKFFILKKSLNDPSVDEDVFDNVWRCWCWKWVL